MEPTIREAVPADARAIRDVHLAAIEGLAGSQYDDQQVAAWAHERDPDGYPIESTETEFVVATREDDLVGFGWLNPQADDYFESAVDGEVTAVYVHPDVAGMGVGGAIYAELERRARRTGCESLGLWASLNAVAFYESRGFSRVTEHRMTFDTDVEGRVVELRKSLSS